MSDRKRNRGKLDSPGDEKILRVSKKVLRSPVERDTIAVNRVKNSVENMEEIKLLLIDMRAQMDANNEEMRKQLEQNKEELRMDIKNIREELRSKEDKWEKEKRELCSRIEQLEERFEAEERNKRKKNIVIKGLKVEKGNERNEVSTFLRKELKIEANISGAYGIKAGDRVLIVASLQNFEDKMEVMKKKSELKGSKIYIENDLTKNEQKIQAEILKIARDRKENGQKVRVGYRKIVVDGEEYRWDTKENGVVLIQRDDLLSKN